MKNKPPKIAEPIMTGHNQCLGTIKKIKHGRKNNKGIHTITIAPPDAETIRVWDNVLRLSSNLGR